LKKCFEWTSEAIRPSSSSLKLANAKLEFRGNHAARNQRGKSRRIFPLTRLKTGCAEKRAVQISRRIPASLSANDGASL